MIPWGGISCCLSGAALYLLGRSSGRFFVFFYTLFDVEFRLCYKFIINICVFYGGEGTRRFLRQLRESISSRSWVCALYFLFWFLFALNVGPLGWFGYM